MSSPPSTIAEWLVLPQCAGADTDRLALIGLGSNLQVGGRQPAQTLVMAIERLAVLSAFPLVVSPFRKTLPVDCPPGTPAFLNAVVALYPADHCTPEKLLDFLLALELSLGRVRSGIRNEARVLDLDLLAYGREHRNTRFLALPHPHACQREFVLAPLVLMWPGYRFAGQSLAVDELLKLCPRPA